VIGEMAEWCNRPLEPLYPVVFIDTMFVKIRDGQVTSRPIYVAVGVTCAGERDILGLWTDSPIIKPRRARASAALTPRGCRHQAPTGAGGQVGGFQVDLRGTKLVDDLAERVGPVLDASDR
jgi:hypothetical protein